MKTQTFTGTVLDAAGDPWEDALVELQLDNGTGEISGPVVTGITDSSGDFSIDAFNNSLDNETLLVRLPNGNLFSVALDPDDDTVALGNLESSGGTTTSRLSEIPSTGGGASVADVWAYKGATDCSTNPNYPAGDAGDLYKVSVAGKIGGSSGTAVSVGDIFVCNTDGTTAGTEAAKGSKWDHFPATADIAAMVDDTAYDATSWNGVTGVAPSKNAVRDKIEALAATIPTVDDTAYDATSWNGVTGVAPSKNAVRDKIETLAPLASPTFTGAPLFPSGSASNPAMGFSAETNLGWYRIQANEVGLTVGGTCNWRFSSSGLFTLRPLAFTSGDPNSVSVDVGIGRAATGVLQVYGGISGGAALQFQSQTAPAAPGAGLSRIYADTSGGKIRLMALFPSGAAQQIAIEP